MKKLSELNLDSLSLVVGINEIILVWGMVLIYYGISMWGSMEPDMWLMGVGTTLGIIFANILNKVFKPRGAA